MSDYQHRVVRFVVIVVAVFGPSMGLLYFFSGTLGPTKESMAKVDLKAIENAALRWEYEFGDLPWTLKELTTRPPGKSFSPLSEHYLVDPWGNKYQYDPNQRHPKTDAPLIWSEGDPRTPGRKISNWDLK
jgi:hypothetical protein